MQRKLSERVEHFWRSANGRAPARTLLASFMVGLLAFALWGGIQLQSGQLAPHGDGFGAVALAAPAQQAEEEEDENGQEAEPENGEEENGDELENDELDAVEEVVAEDENTVEIPQNAELSLEKSYTGFLDLDDDGELSIGDVISYTFALTNTGNVTLGEILLTDELLDMEEATCGESTLAPLLATSCVYTYTVTQDDILAGEIVNIATATAQDPNEETVEAEAETTIEIPQNPGLALEKSFAGFTDVDDNGELSLNDIITYSFVITNTGNVLLDPVRLDDAMLGLQGVTCGESSLAPGEMTSCEHTYIITQADVDAGEINNAATATGVVPTGENDQE